VRLSSPGLGRLFLLVSGSIGAHAGAHRLVTLRSDASMIDGDTATFTASSWGSIVMGYRIAHPN
jgi:hypothetical protein